MPSVPPKEITPTQTSGKSKLLAKQPIAVEAGRIRAKLNFISLITDGNESQNIRLFDGDVSESQQSDQVLREHLLKAGQDQPQPAVPGSVCERAREDARRKNIAPRQQPDPGHRHGWWTEGVAWLG